MSIPEFYNFASDVIDRWASDPKHEALWWVDETGGHSFRLSFAELRDASIKIAGAFQKAGFQPGDRVLVGIGRQPAWWLTMIGLIRAGIVAVPGTTLLTAKDLKFRADAARITGAVAAAPVANRIDEIREDLPRLRYFLSASGPRENWTSLDEVLDSPAEFEAPRTKGNDPCLIYFTSGTTGPPKMVMHSHASYPLGHAVTGRDWLGLHSSDLHWNLSDTGWAKAAWSSLFGPWSQGATVFVQEPGAKFDPDAMLETLRRFPITTLCAPPTIFRQLVHLDLAGAGLSKLRQVVAAGEPLNPEVISLWKQATGTTIRDGYGQTETTLLLGNLPGREVRPGSMGLPAPGYDVTILDDNLEPLAPNQEGEVAIRISPTRPLGLFLGYEDNPEENAKKFRGDYYLTGDRAYRDEDGYFWFVGRADDVILSGGYRIGPFEVESALLEHPSVQESAVIGAPDPTRYQIVKAFILLRPGWTPSPELAREIQDHVKKVTAPYKYPREIEFVDSLPKTVSGKIKRNELRRLEEDKAR